MKEKSICLVIGILSVVFVHGVFAKVNINTATFQELQTLPQVGPSTARAIIDYRELHGPFMSIHDITKVPQIGEKTA